MFGWDAKKLGDDPSEADLLAAATQYENAVGMVCAWWLAAWADGSITLHEATQRVMVACVDLPADDRQLLVDVFLSKVASQQEAPRGTKGRIGRRRWALLVDWVDRAPASCLKNHADLEEGTAFHWVAGVASKLEGQPGVVSPRTVMDRYYRTRKGAPITR